jgi:hypothetical protein
VITRVCAVREKKFGNVDDSRERRRRSVWKLGMCQLAQAVVARTQPPPIVDVPHEVAPEECQGVVLERLPSVGNLRRNRAKILAKFPVILFRHPEQVRHDQDREGPRQGRHHFKASDL